MDKLCEFPGEKIISMANHKELLVVITDKSAYLVDDEGNKTLIEDA